MGFSEGTKIKCDLKGCILKVVATGERLFKFNASTAEEKTKRGQFAGSGIAVHSHAFKIATSKVFNYEPYNHQVIIDGVDYLIVAKQPATKISAGERFAKKKYEAMILFLE